MKVNQVFIICILISTSLQSRLVNEGNREYLQQIASIYAKEFQNQYGSLNLRHFTTFQDFMNIQFKDISIRLFPSEDETGSSFKGILTLKNLQFDVISNFNNEIDQSNVLFDKINIDFILYSNYSFMNIDDIEFGEDNILYQASAKTISNLINLTITKNLRSLNNILKSQEQNIETFQQIAKQWFSEQAEQIIEKDGEKSVFEIDVLKYFGKKVSIKRPKIDEEIFINNLEDLEKLTLNLNVGNIKGNTSEL